MKENEKCGVCKHFYVDNEHGFKCVKKYFFIEPNKLICGGVSFEPNKLKKALDNKTEVIAFAFEGGLFTQRKEPKDASDIPLSLNERVILYLYDRVQKLVEELESSKNKKCSLCGTNVKLKHTLPQIPVYCKDCEEKLLKTI